MYPSDGDIAEIQNMKNESGIVVSKFINKQNEKTI